MIEDHRPDVYETPTGSFCTACLHDVDEHSKWPIADVIATIVGLVLLSVMFAAIILARASS